MIIEITAALVTFAAGYKYGGYVESKITAEVSREKAATESAYDALKAKAEAASKAIVPAASSAADAVGQKLVTNLDAL